MVYYLNNGNCKYHPNHNDSFTYYLNYDNFNHSLSQRRQLPYNLTLGYSRVNLVLLVFTFYVDEFQLDIQIHFLPPNEIYICFVHVSPVHIVWGR